MNSGPDIPCHIRHTEITGKEFAMFICGPCGAAFSNCPDCWAHTDECENANSDWQYGIVNGILEVTN